MFAEAGVDFEDVRFEKEQFMEEKAKAPFGLFPYMSVDDEFLGQSMACARFIARQHKPELLGAPGLEEARVNEIVYAWGDVQDLLIAAHFAESEIEKEKKKAKIAPLMKALHDKLETNNGGQGYFVGDKLTLADIVCYNIMFNVLEKRPETAEQLPLLKSHHDRVAASPNIKTWIEKRPATEM